MQVILLERIAKLGQMGDVVDIKPGFARNFLLPKGKALLASKTNVEKFKTQKAQLEAQNLETRKEAEDFAKRIVDQTFIIIRSASENGSLYGSVNSRDAAQAASGAGFLLDRKQVIIDRPIKELGVHKVTVALHPEVSTALQLNVARSEAEAELQASGKTIQEKSAEETAAAELEIAELFDEIGAAQFEEDELLDEELMHDTSHQGNPSDIETDKRHETE